MKGLELSYLYYKEYGYKMIHENFFEYEHLIAIGSLGSGSECYGLDDDVSQDHDFEIGFCMFVPNDFSDDLIFKLEKAYAKLPNSFMGYTRRPMSLINDTKYGVFRISEFYKSKIGYESGFKNDIDWFKVEETYILESSNGEIFRDDLGEFSKIRASLLSIPKDVILKKLNGNLLLAYLAGTYNFNRSLKRGDIPTAMLCAYEYFNHITSVIYNLNNTFKPYYKLSIKGLSKLNILSHLEGALKELITIKDVDKISELILYINKEVSLELYNQKLIIDLTLPLNIQAIKINDLIKSAYIRNLHILAGVK